MNNDKELCERLNAMLSHRGDGIPTQFINPDGPEAAARIEALNAMVAELDSGAMRLRACICEIVEARDEEDFERIIAAIDDARDEATLSALGEQGPCGDFRP